MYYVYAISSQIKNYIYVGLTNNIQQRIKRHEKGWEPTTKQYKPFDIVFLTSVDNRQIARQIEIFLKSGIGKEFLKSLK